MKVKCSECPAEADLRPNCDDLTEIFNTLLDKVWRPVLHAHLAKKGPTPEWSVSPDL